MKAHLPTLVLTAVVSSLATVGALELLRSRVADPQPALAGEPVSAPGSPTSGDDVAALSSTGPARASTVLDTRMATRLAELERRMEALESRTGSATSGTESPPFELPEGDGLRVLILDWIAEERAVWAEEEERKRKEKKRQQLEFNARYQAYMTKKRHGLKDWEEERLIAIFLETGIRTAAIEDSIDLAKDDPVEVEKRWEEFDEWVDRYEREQMGPELWNKLATDD